MQAIRAGHGERISNIVGQSGLSDFHPQYDEAILNGLYQAQGGESCGKAVGLSIADEEVQ